MTESGERDQKNIVHVFILGKFITAQRSTNKMFTVHNKEKLPFKR
jgi:hypothetical protein